MARLDRIGFNGLSRTLRFVSIRLRPYADAIAIREQADALRVQLVEKEETWQQALEERVAATAEIAYRDEILGDLIASMARELMVIAGGDRRSAKYRKLMPTAPSVAMKKVASDFQTRYVKTILAVLRDDTDFVSLKHFSSTIETAQGALEQAMATRSELGIPESRAQTDRQIVLDEVRRFIGLARAQLTLLFPDDPELVRSFFPRANRPKPVAIDDWTEVASTPEEDDQMI